MDSLYERINHKSDTGLPIKVYRTTDVYLHWHEEYEFVMIEGGSALCIINGEPVEFDENKVIFLQSGILHSIHSNRAAKLTAIVVSPSFWSGEEGSELFNGQITFQSVFNTADPTDLAVIEILKYIVSVYDSQGFGCDFIMKAKFAELFAILIEHGRFSKSKKQTQKLPAGFKNLMNHIHSNYNEKITLDTLSAVSFYSATYIIRLFKKYTNLTPAEYIIQYRLSLAKAKLQNGSETNLDIAISCGFNSESYFIRVFKKRYGMTPQAYRNKWRNSVNEKSK